MPEIWDKERLAELFRQAGALALDYYEAPPMELKSDATVVTAADRAVEALFAAEFDRADTGSYLIGEETVFSHTEAYLQAALRAKAAYVLDPIDGTTPYTLHLPVWSNSLGLMECGKLSEGALYIPPIDRMLISERGKLFTRRLRQPDDWQEFSLTPCALGKAGHIGIGQLQARAWSFSGQNQLIAWSGCASSFYKVLTGELLGYIGTFKLWDAAAMLPIYRAAGAVMRLLLPGLPELTEASFELAPGAHRWKVQASVVAAQTLETAQWLAEHFTPNAAHGKEA